MPEKDYRFTMLLLCLYRGHKKVSHFVCKGICTKHKTVKIGGSWYGGNNKRCQACDIFISWDGLFCPCCGGRVRSKARNKKRVEMEVRI